MAMPPPLPGTAVRILATSDLGANAVPLRTTTGPGGTIHGIAALLEREERALWLDLGDLVVGNPSYPLLGERPWADVMDLPIAAAAVGNHDFDDGIEAVPELPFPLLCANAGVGLPATALLGEVGVIGLTHPQVHEFTRAPAPYDDWPERVPAHARELRRDGARWVVALLHEGVTWWPSDGGVATRQDRLDAVAGSWAPSVDLIVCGHNFASWTGRIAGTPAGEPHLFAGSVLVADLGEEVTVRGVFRVPPVRSSPTPATEAIDAAAQRVVGKSDVAWLARTGAEHYLPDLLAEAFRAATGAEAGFALANHHGIQPPFDGVLAALGPGEVSELDVVRMCAALDYDLAVAELRPGELERARRAQWAQADPRNRAGDAEAENWCRMPAGVSGDGTSVATLAAVVPRLRHWLGRDLEVASPPISARDALISLLAR
jgi:2',3'-cyclic-nucleotide 2'-phosphodiesterase (5'-nucleotidase family)